MSVLVVDKPVGPTSYDVVRRVQRRLARHWGIVRPSQLKVGHGGTLDPLASGVLPVCVGQGTKLAPFLLDADKEYEASVRFGIETDTLDAAGAVTAEASTAGLDRARLELALEGFRGPITQVPPMYSALKHKGRPLHEYARAGAEVARAARALVVHELVLLELDGATARLRVRCSKGTYVRVLAADLGRALGMGAHLAALRRTVSGPFHLGQALPLEAIEAELEAGRLPAMVSLSDALAHLPAVSPADEVVAALAQGKKLPAAALNLPDDAAARLRVLRADGSLLSIVEVVDGVVRTLRGFNPISAVSHVRGSSRTVATVAESLAGESPPTKSY
jgi:tRNA pseudouridine55 synthase